MSWNTTWDYVSELLREPSSHINSALLGDKYVPADAERAAYSVYEGWLNTQIKSGRKKVPRPWTGKKPNYKKPKPLKADPASIARREKLAAMF